MPSGNGSPIQTYKVYRNGALYVSVMAAYFADNDVVNSATYTYEVSAVNGVREGAMSDGVSITSPTYAVIPSAVSDIVYNGAVQTGVPEGVGNAPSGHKVIEAGRYTATAMLALLNFISEWGRAGGA